MLLNVLLQFIANVIRAPGSTGNEMLEIGGSLFPQVLCKLPAVLAFDLSDESPQIPNSLSLHLDASQQRTKSLRHTIEFLSPASQVP